MDEVDIANDLIEQDMALRLAALRSKRRTIGPELCDECEENIPAERRLLGLVLCIDCARARERAAKMFSRG